jgi:hypothetical protein
MSKKLLLSLTLMAGVMFVAVSPALATTPCTGRNAGAYNLGKTLGAQIAKQAWASSSQDPDDFEEFAAFVRGTVADAIADLPNDASPYTKCRAKGLAQGVCDGLGWVQDQVAGVCLLDGQTWGLLAGDLYCALATEFGAVEALGLLPVPPTTVCGENFVSGCESEFQSYATATCESFTIAPHEVEFADWQGGMCAYELP